MDERIIIIPDVHAGYANSRVAELADRLPGWLDPPPRLVFIGDVLDLWRADPADALEAAKPLLSVIKGFLQQGGTVDYLLGNHDYHLLSDLINGGPIHGLLPDGIRFHHRYLGLTHQHKRILLTHGDDYDFLYISLCLLPFGLAPDDVYDFYEFVYGLDKDEIRGWDKDRLRGLLLVWLRERLLLPGFLPPEALAALSLTEDAALATGSPLFEPQMYASPQFLAGNTSAPQTLSLFSLWDYLRAFHTVSDLTMVSQHTPVAQTWASILNYEPYDQRRPITDFQPYDHLVVGHFHDPRRPSGLPVTDCGSWVTDPNGLLKSGNYVEITGGQINLFFMDTGAVLVDPL